VGPGLDALIVYGSAADGTAIEGFSDLDFLVLLHDPLSPVQSCELQLACSRISFRPFAYLQGTTIDRAMQPTPLLVPGTFSVVYGEIPDLRIVHTEDSFGTSCREWLRQLPQIVYTDTADWAFVDPDARPRLFRRLVTRLKPSLKALMVGRGSPASVAWKLDYGELARWWYDTSSATGPALVKLVAELPIEPDEELESGRVVLETLNEIIGFRG
jgi:hypothetical protein